MSPFHHLIPLFLTLITPVFGAQSYKALVAPITQTGPSSSPFTITLNQNENLIIDIESPFSWHHCSKGFPRVPCRAPQCSSAQSNKSPSCRLPRPWNRPYRPCTCSTSPFNPFTKTCALSQLSYSSVSITSTDGHTPLTKVKYNKVFMSCAPKLLLNSLPENSSGIASLSRGSLSLIPQFSSVKVSQKFGMCLGDQGVAFFGEGPYYLLPPPGRDVSQFLSYTPLLKNPKDALGYYIGLKGISVNLQAVKLSPNMLSFDSLGNGGVKLSTVTPYTTMKSNIYGAFFSLFSRTTSKYPRVPKVAPFDLCFNSTKLGSTRVGYAVPQIDLQLSNGGNWTIFGANSLMQVSDDVACLGFVDGGVKAKQDVVIGSLQMQHNFLLFDLAKSRLGFSSLLFFFQTTCNNFNFTSGL
ncbi:chitinase CLP-like [Silene latifolia]|uniref:chitinase CLP-like n=1 Tax=Silene latifolia TaxID=37657 RepID=UPI003D788F07